MQYKQVKRQQWNKHRLIGRSYACTVIHPSPPPSKHSHKHSHHITSHHPHHITITTYQNNLSVINIGSVTHPSTPSQTLIDPYTRTHIRIHTSTHYLESRIHNFISIRKTITYIHFWLLRSLIDTGTKECLYRLCLHKGSLCLFPEGYNVMHWCISKNVV